MKMVLLFGFALSVSAFAADRKFDIMDGTGKVVGQGFLGEIGSGIKLTIDLKGALPGSHGMHIHENGSCIGPKFESAGGHLNPDKKGHGYANPNGHHLGDLPNLDVAKSGTTRKDLMLNSVAMKSLMTATGTSLVIHAKPDDEKSDPSGNSGDRIYCGVLTEASK